MTTLRIERLRGRAATSATTVTTALAILLGALGPEAAMAAPQAAARKVEPVTLNFNNADIEAVARTMATLTGRNVVVDPRVRGTISLSTDKPVTPQVAFNQFSAQLRLQGFTVVQSDGLYKVVPEADAKLQSGSVSAGPVAGGNNQIVTQIFRLSHENANNLLPVLRPLISPNNSLNVNPGNNSLIITDYADNLRRISRIISSLDVANASDVEVIPLKHALASELAPLVTRLLDSGAPTGGAAQGGGSLGQGESFRTTLMPEPRGNALILRAANPARVSLVRTLVEKLDRPATASADDAIGNINVVHLKNADATQLAQTLRGVLASEAAAAGNQGGVGTPVSLQGGNTGARPPTTGGQIQADTATNSLIITAPGPQYRQLRAVIDRLDSRRAQVWVESLIAEVNTDKAAEFGIQWQGPIGRASNGLIGLLGTNFGTGGNNILNLATQGLAGTTPSGGVTPGTGLNVGAVQRTNGVNVLGFLARALEQSGSGNILSTPNLLTLDNEEARIVIGQNVPFVTGRYTNTGVANNGVVNPFQTIERRDVGLTLRVRPQISETGSVKMAISQEVSSVQPSSVNSPSGPITNKRSIDSNVLVDDGSIVVLGGLLQDDYADNEERVPVLGNLPVVGNLFKNRSRSRKKTNLMVFLRPVVVRDATATEDLSMDRYEMMRAQQSQSQGQPHPMLPVPAPAGLPPLQSRESQRPAQAQPVPPTTPVPSQPLPPSSTMPPINPGSTWEPRDTPAPLLPPSNPSL